MTTPQPAALPEHTIGRHDHPEPHTMCWSELELDAIKRYAESYALAALQSQPAAAGVSDAASALFEVWRRTEFAQRDGEFAHPDLSKYAADYQQAWAEVAKRARAILALRPQSEPVGEAGTMPGTSGFTMACFHADKVPVGTKLYADALRPQAVPMTDATIDGHLRSLVGPDVPMPWSFTCGVRFAEAHHGITAQGAQGGEAK